MKIVIFGSTRGTGREAVQQALAQGHDVTAFARNPAAVAPAGGERLRVVAGDAFDARAVEEAVAGQDAVLNSLGTRPWSYQEVCSAGTRNIIRAMEARGVRRIVTVSAFGIGETRKQVPWIGRKLFLDPILGREYADKEVMERELRASSLEWVTLQPVFLTNGSRRGDVRAWTGERWVGGWFISRADERELRSAKDALGKASGSCRRAGAEPPLGYRFHVHPDEGGRARVHLSGDRLRLSDLARGRGRDLTGHRGRAPPGRARARC